MKEHPILFSTTMVQAILAGRKTQTRRVMKSLPVPVLVYDEEQIFERNPIFPQYIEQKIPVRHNPDGSDYYEILKALKCRYGAPGDALWVRETWGIGDKSGAKYYRANTNYPGTICRWRPSIHMPKAIGRIWSVMKEVRVERLQDITAEDAIAEGIESMVVNEDGELVTKYRDYTSSDGWYHDPVDSFKSLWFSINGPDSWKENPWVWVVSFRVLSTTGRPANLEELCAAR